MSIQEIQRLNRAHRKRIEEIYLDAWQKGVSPRYRDERCKDKNQFIAANSDGSEDLVLLDLNKVRSSVLQKNVTAPGKGNFAYLLKRKYATATWFEKLQNNQKYNN
jgi:hypothetical protein